MRHCNNLRHLLRTVALATAAAIVTLTSCTKVDDTLGSNIIPDNQQMLAGFTQFPGQKELNPRKYVETRLYQTDSIIASNINYGYLGAILSDTLGLRSAGFLSQFTSYFPLDSGYFGYRPIFDSIQLMISVKTFSGDTTQVVPFAVYEVISNKYLTEKPLRPKKNVRDTVFYLNFHPETPAPGTEPILGDKLFTFELGGKIGPSSGFVRMTPTQAGHEYINRLTLQSGNYKGRYGIYSIDSLSKWVEEFKGIYIKPDLEKSTPAMGKGAIYSTNLETSGFALFGRNRRKEDPTLIKDTIGLIYFFYTPTQSIGKVSINSIKRDYTLATSEARINIDDARETNVARPENPHAYVEGMGGVATQITFTPEFFKALVDELQLANEKTGRGFASYAFSQVNMSIYFKDSNYDWTITPANPTNWIREMTSAPTRLGLYTNYNSMTSIVDYDYYTEQITGSELSYGGKINRSRGCYVMNITGHVQQLWNSFNKQAKLTNGTQIDWTKIDWSKVEKRSVYLAPEATSLYTASYGVLQGAATEPGAAISNNAPIRFDLTYNMIK